MKHIAQNYKSGELSVLDAPEPQSAAGGVLVRSLYSLISTGTELMKVSESQLSLIGKARARPDQVRKMVDTARQQGAVVAYQKAMSRLDSLTPLGYSLAGVVEEVGTGAGEFTTGQLVACAGNEFALHAEANWVPTNLCVPVPDGVSPSAAAFATVGSIALQGVRQGRPQLGETACVVGLGLVGQLVVQLLVANGVKVVGIDVVAERCRLAEACGALLAVPSGEEGLQRAEDALAAASGGIGADTVFLVAGGASNAPVEAAVRLARDRGCLVDIGKCRLDLPWNAAYEKELELRFSRSYGPGRYDYRYEVEGVDYPPGYVRWTERRNLGCVLDLMAAGHLAVEALIAGVFPVTEAPEVYERLQAGSLPGVGYLFSYPAASGYRRPGPAPALRAVPVATPDAVSPTGPRSTTHPSTPQPSTASPSIPQRSGMHPSIPHPSIPPGLGSRAVRVGFVGAGNYATSMLLPNLTGRDDLALVRVATRRSLSAANAQRKFGFAEATTAVDEVLGDGSLDAVFVATRHSSHADLVCRALEAGKAVFVEKPLCLDDHQLDTVLDTVRRTGNDRVFVGFNRRFAPLLVEMRDRFGDRDGPVLARYHVNAGTLGADSWYGMADVEGSRFVGEGGHFVDVVSWWVGTDPVEVTVTPAGEAGDLQVGLRYSDGSLGVITYTTRGHPRFPKETFDVTGVRRAARLDNFTRATVWSGHRRRVHRSLGAPDKGQKAELDAFLNAVRTGGPMPISLSSLVATTRATFATSAGPALPGAASRGAASPGAASPGAAIATPGTASPGTASVGTASVGTASGGTVAGGTAPVGSPVP